jgi:NAD(P)-dependent dehydrogenase (short-subunit alcohol dehydrogenase family)
VDGVKPLPSPVHFATSAAALRGMVEAMSKELGNYNIRVNLVAPGILDGGSSAKLGHEMKDAYLKHSALGRFGTMAEIAEVVAWLALENTYVTGQVILLDGGL